MLITVTTPVMALERFGGVGDGVTDNTAAWQRAIDQVRKKGRGIVRVPDKGTFLMGQVGVVPGLVIEGYGGIAKARAGADNYLIANTNGNVSVDDVEIHGLIVDGNKANNASGGGLYLSGARNRIADCRIHDTVGAGILFGPGGGKGAVNAPDASLELDRIYTRNCGKHNSWGHIGIMHGRGTVSNVTTEGDDGGGTYGVDIEPEHGNAIGMWTFTNVTTRAGRLFLDCANLTDFGADITVLGCSIDARGSYCAPDTDPANMAPLFLRQLKRLVVDSCDFIGHDALTYGGLYVEPKGIKTRNSIEEMILSNCHFICAAPAARTGYFASVAGAVLSGNHWDVHTRANALEFTGRSSQVFAKGNIIRNRGAGQAIAIGATASGVIFDESNSLSGNVRVSAAAAARHCRVGQEGVGRDAEI